MTMPTVEELKKKVQEAGFVIIEADRINDDSLKLNITPNQTEALDLFLQLASHNQIKHLFLDICNMREVELEYAAIDIESLTEDRYGTHCKDLIRKAKEYNARIIKSAEKEPYSIALFFLDTTRITYELIFCPEWAASSSGQKILDQFVEEYKEAIETFRESRRHELVQNREGIMKVLSEDPIFQSCKQKSTRKDRFFDMFDAATADRYTLKEIEGMVEIAWAKFNANRAKK